jgi:hypothetical protein
LSEKGGKNQTMDIVMECIITYKSLSTKCQIAKITSIEVRGNVTTIYTMSDDIKYYIIDTANTVAVSKLTVGMMIPVLIVNCKSINMTSNISCESTFYMTGSHLDVYKLEAFEANDVIKAKQNEIKALIAEIKTLPKHEYFNELLYEFKNDRTPNDLMVDMYDTLSFKGYYFRVSGIHILDDRIGKVKDADSARMSKLAKISASNYDSYMKLLQSVYDDLLMLRSMCKVYVGDEFVRHKPLWDFYESIKK